MKREDFSEKKFVFVTENGVAAQNMSRNEIVAWLLYAFLSIFEEANFEINKMKASEKIMDMLYAMQPDEPDELDGQMSFFDFLFGDDEEENG